MSAEKEHNIFGFCFCHAVCWSCATERREPCQAGNRAALSGQPVRHSPPAHRVTEAKFFVPAGTKNSEVRFRGKRVMLLRSDVVLRTVMYLLRKCFGRHIRVLLR